MNYSTLNSDCVQLNRRRPFQLYIVDQQMYLPYRAGTLSLSSLLCLHLVFCAYKVSQLQSPVQPTLSAMPIAIIPTQPAMTTQTQSSMSSQSALPTCTESICLNPTQCATQSSAYPWPVLCLCTQLILQSPMPTMTVMTIYVPVMPIHVVSIATQSAIVCPTMPARLLCLLLSLVYIYLVCCMCLHVQNPYVY